MCTAHSLLYSGVSVWGEDFPEQSPPDGKPPWTETPLDRYPTVMWPVVHVGNRITHSCKNITLPQTSFGISIDTF